MLRPILVLFLFLSLSIPHLLPALALALLTNTTAPQVPTVNCHTWHSRIPPPAGCEAAIALIRQEPFYADKTVWRVSGQDLVVRKWRSEFCAIAVVAKVDGVEDKFKMSLVAWYARIIIWRCLNGHEPAGGSAEIGFKRVFDVVVGRRGSFAEEEAAGVGWWERV